MGIFSGFAAILLKNFVHFLQKDVVASLINVRFGFLTPFTPLLGIILSVLTVRFLFGGKVVRGLSNIIYSIIRKKSDLPPRKIISHLLTSGLTIGMGGSAGLEAPIVVIGSSIGSNVARELNLSYRTKTLLLACGAAAGISAIFNSPIAGVIFAMEVLLPEITVNSLIPLLLASASASVLSRFLYSGQLFYLVTEGWHLEAVPFYIVLGILCGFLSVYTIRTNHVIENFFHSYNKTYIKAIIGGLILCSLIFLFPPLFGEGYSTVIKLLRGKEAEILNGTIFNFIHDKQLALIIFVSLVVLAKAAATSVTIGAGGNGGVIAPSLFTGALTGLLLVLTAGYLGMSELNRQNFIVVGMAGILSGVIHAPLTGIFLIAEVTGGYVLIVPLMIVVALSYFISKYFNKYSIYTLNLAQMGVQFRSKKDHFYSQDIRIADFIEKDFVILNPGMTLGIVVENLKHTNRNIFPVVNKKGMLVGVLTLNDIREILIDTEAYDVIVVEDLMTRDFETIDVSADFSEVMENFENSNMWNMAVTDKGRYVGFISKSNILQKYITTWGHQQTEEV